MIILILGTGLYLQIRLGFMPLFKIGCGFRMIWKGRTPGAGAEGEITPYAALMTALSATIGTGNIAGVATAILDEVKRRNPGIFTKSGLMVGLGETMEEL